ncbi:hypothetical protein HDU76_003817 [Blyttiomyces sp. JEL0837]|nr:hypothetical protein HDU76_003817 [Blyttiomyces sp. JEL0837]
MKCGGLVPSTLHGQWLSPASSLLYSTQSSSSPSSSCGRCSCSIVHYPPANIPINAIMKSFTLTFLIPNVVLQPSSASCSLQARPPSKSTLLSKATVLPSPSTAYPMQSCNTHSDFTRPKQSPFYRRGYHLHSATASNSILMVSFLKSTKSLYNMRHRNHRHIHADFRNLSNNINCHPIHPSSPTPFTGLSIRTLSPSINQAQSYTTKVANASPHWNPPQIGNPSKSRRRARKFTWRFSGPESVPVEMDTFAATGNAHPEVDEANSSEIDNTSISTDEELVYREMESVTIQTPLLYRPPLDDVHKSILIEWGNIHMPSAENGMQLPSELAGVELARTLNSTRPNTVNAEVSKADSLNQDVQQQPTHEITNNDETPTCNQPSPLNQDEIDKSRISGTLKLRRVFGTGLKVTDEELESSGYKRSDYVIQGYNDQRLNVNLRIDRPWILSTLWHELELNVNRPWTAEDDVRLLDLVWDHVLGKLQHASREKRARLQVPHIGYFDVATKLNRSANLVKQRHLLLGSGLKGERKVGKFSDEEARRVCDAVEEVWRMFGKGNVTLEMCWELVHPAVLGISTDGLKNLLREPFPDDIPTGIVDLKDKKRGVMDDGMVYTQQARLFWFMVLGKSGLIGRTMKDCMNMFRSRFVNPPWRAFDDEMLLEFMWMQSQHKQSESGLNVMESGKLVLNHGMIPEDLFVEGWRDMGRSWVWLRKRYIELLEGVTGSRKEGPWETQETRSLIKAVDFVWQRFQAHHDMIPHEIRSGDTMSTANKPLTPEQCWELVHPAVLGLPRERIASLLQLSNLDSGHKPDAKNQPEQQPEQEQHQSQDLKTKYNWNKLTSWSKQSQAMNHLPRLFWLMVIGKAGITGRKIKECEKVWMCEHKSWTPVMDEALLLAVKIELSKLGVEQGGDGDGVGGGDDPVVIKEDGKGNRGNKGDGVKGLLVKLQDQDQEQDRLSNVPKLAPSVGVVVGQMRHDMIVNEETLKAFQFWREVVRYISVVVRRTVTVHQAYRRYILLVGEGDRK